MPAPEAVPHRLNVGDLRKLFGRSSLTISRWVKAGILPAPEYVGGLRVWNAADVLRVEERLRRVPPRGFSPGAADRGRAAANAFREMREAAGAALVAAGVQPVAEVLQRHRVSRLADVPLGERARVTRELRHLAMTSSEPREQKEQRNKP